MPEGRQSPDPETQHGKQGTDPVAKPGLQGAAGSEHAAKNDSDKQLTDSLPSNPAHVMDDKAKEKTAKTTSPPS